MSTITGDEISKMLRDGWKVAGFSIAAVTDEKLIQSVLLQRELSLMTVNVLTERGNERARTSIQIAPSTQPPPIKRSIMDL